MNDLFRQIQGVIHKNQFQIRIYFYYSIQIEPALVTRMKAFHEKYVLFIIFDFKLYFRKFFL
jgi:hypothetical protein